MYYMYVTSKRVRDRLIFDRENSRVTYCYNYGLRRRTFAYDETLYQSLSHSLRHSNAYYLVMRFPRTQSFARVSTIYPFMFMSLYTWFMDKNRPLPPGSAFDAYREADYLRRKGEGFPDPLYLSGIKIGEWKGATEKYEDRTAKFRFDSHYEPKLSKQVPGSEPNFRTMKFFEERNR